jgi:hypothetical protein
MDTVLAVQGFHNLHEALEGIVILLPGPLWSQVVLDGQVFITPLVEKAVNEDAGLLEVRVEAGKRGVCFRGEN